MRSGDARAAAGRAGEAYDYPDDFFAPRAVRFARAAAGRATSSSAAAALLRAAKRPLIVAGGGVLYAKAARGAARASPKRMACRSPRRRPARARCRGTIRCRRARSASPARRRRTRSRATPIVVLAVGTRLQDFTTGSHSLFAQARLVALNVNAFDALQVARRRRCAATRAAALDALDARARRLARGRAWTDARDARGAATGATTSRAITGATRRPALPYDGEVIGAVQRSAPDSPARDIVVCAAGTLPAELHKLWRTAAPGGYHIEYGYSCMGYEIAGGLGVKMAQPDREVVVMVGDGSYLMLNSEIATSVMLGHEARRSSCSTTAASAASTGCSRRAAARRSTTCSTTACRGRRARRRSTSRRTRASLGALAEHVDDDRRARSGAGARARRRPHLRRRASTPIPRARPTRAAGGGKWRCRKCRSAPRCARRAPSTSTARQRRRP